MGCLRRTLGYVFPMKKLELSDETYAVLQRLAAAKHLAPGELIASMLRPAPPDLSGDSLLFYLTGPDFTRHRDAHARYLGLLAWCARNYAADFADFVSHQESGRRYLACNRAEINETRVRNQARQIGGTHYWAVMNLDPAARRRFVGRLLEFIGCHDETVSLAVEAVAPIVPAPEELRHHGT